MRGIFFLNGGVGGVLTASKSKLSSFWRGTTVTISISQRKATSVGVRPGGKGNAMFDRCGISVFF